MNAANDLSRMVPGFDFLQSFMKGASASLPGVQGFGQWVAPTLDPEELDKRIQELKTVQFWLEQNARLLGATIQALEVQRMTLSTLQTMNLPLAELRDALQARPSTAPAPVAAPAAPFAWARPEPAAADEAKDDKGDDAAAEGQAAAAAPAPAPAAVDPMQWWGALTQQFTEIASKAVKDSSTEAARQLSAAAAQAKPASPPPAKKKAAAKSAPAAKKKPAPTSKAAPRKRAG